VPGFNFNQVAFRLPEKALVSEHLYRILMNLLRLPYTRERSISWLTICRRSSAYTIRRNAGEPTFCELFGTRGVS
jgi:hypothetical protein